MFGTHCMLLFGYQVMYIPKYINTVRYYISVNVCQFSSVTELSSVSNKEKVVN